MDDAKPIRIQEFGYRKPRFRVDFHFLMQVEGRGSQLFDARCTDLSEEGLAACVHDHLDVGSAVTFILTLPGSVTSIRLRALVNYRQDECHGFKFEFSSNGEREFVHRYLAALQSSIVPFKQPK